MIGYTTWPEEWKKTRFLEFIGEQGWQFGFSLIEDFENVPFNFFYTSNLSMPRKLFRIPAVLMKTSPYTGGRT